MPIELLRKEQYRELQKLGNFDTKTSSWVKTPADIRKLGGALFCDRRFGHVFAYHNGAQSYYSARSFRGSLRVQILHRQLNLNLRTNPAGCRHLESRWNSLHTGVDEAQTKLPSRPVHTACCNVDGRAFLFNPSAVAS